MNRSLPFLLAALLVPALQDSRATGDWAAAPKGLDHYVNRLPGKSIPQLRMEAPSASQPLAGIDEDQASALLEEIAANLAKKPRADSLAACEAFLEKARWSAYLGAAWTNIALDLRDALSDAQTTDAQAADYGRWRVDLGPLIADDTTELAARIRTRLEKTPDRTAAHLHYLLGALAFQSYEGSKGVDEFAHVVKTYPDHPRAETAAFVLGRAHLEASRNIYDDETLAKSLLDEADEAFQHYLKTYPQGRYVGDVLGWLGAVEVKRDNLAGALGHYLEQMDVPGHPENHRSASRMVERVLGRLLAVADEAPIQKIARRPAVAMGTVYWLLHAPEADMHNGFFDKPEVVKKWRSWWLPRLAAAVRAERETWEKEAALPWFLAILVHAASDAGDQAGALAILTEAGDLAAKSDDLAFARCVVLQREGKDASHAAAAWREFLAGHPQSTLRDGAILRLAMTLQSAGQADEAVIAVAALRARQQEDLGDETASGSYFDNPIYPWSYESLLPAASSLSPDVNLADPGQVAQHLDALLTFAPLDQLARLGSRKDDFSEHHWAWVQGAVLGRLLSEGRADDAAAFLPEGADGEAANTISRLAKEASRTDTPGSWQALGEAWLAARGRVTYPALLTHRDEIYIEGQSDSPERLLQENAVALGLGAGQETWRILLSMDEAMNALRAWERAAQKATPGSPDQARALESILETMPKVAAATPWARRTAAHEGWTATAKQVHDTLLTQCPDSPEAKRAARPAFRDPEAPRDGEPPEPEPAAPSETEEGPFAQEDPGWIDSHYDGGQPYLRHREFIFDDIAGLGADAEAEGGHDFNDILQALYSINPASPRSKGELLGLRERSRRSYTHWSQGCVHSAVEDLAELAESQAPPATVFERYFALRVAVINVCAFQVYLELRPVNGDLTSGEAADQWVLDALTKAEKDPAMKAVADRLGCLRLLVLSNRLVSLPVRDETGEVREEGLGGETTIETRDYALVEKEADAWLAAYPKSAKREQAWLLAMRAAYRARRPLLRSVGAEFPMKGGSIGGFYVRLPQANLLPWDAAPVESKIAAYEKEFPAGRYAAEVRDLRSALAVAAGHWPDALTLCLANLDDPRHPDLHSDAGLRLTNLFAKLGDPALRPEILAAVLASPRARECLAAYLEATDESASLEPLVFLSEWLRERLKG